MASGASLAGVGFSLIAAATSVFGAAMSWRSLDAYRDATIYSERLHACTQALRTMDQIAEAVDTVQFAAENTTPDTANYSEASLALAVAIRPFFDSAGDLSLLGPLPLIEKRARGDADTRPAQQRGRRSPSHRTAGPDGEDARGRRRPARSVHTDASARALGAARGGLARPQIAGCVCRAPALGRCAASGARHAFRTG